MCNEKDFKAILHTCANKCKLTSLDNLVKEIRKEQNDTYYIALPIRLKVGGYSVSVWVCVVMVVVVVEGSHLTA